MKKLLLLLLFTSLLNAQTVILTGVNNNTTPTATVGYIPATPTNQPGNRTDVYELKGIDYWKFSNYAGIYYKF